MGITGTLLVIVIAAIIAIPIGIMVGIHLSEHPKTKFSNVTRFLTDLIQGSPSIVIGIIAYAWVVKPLGSYSAPGRKCRSQHHDAPADRAFHGRNIKNASRQFKRSRTSIRCLIYQCYTESVITCSFRRIIYRYPVGDFPCYGGNGPAHADRFGEYRNQLGCHETDERCSLIDLGILQRPQSDRYDLEFLALPVNVSLNAQYNSKTNCQKMESSIIQRLTIS